MSELRSALRAAGHEGPVSGGGGYRLAVGDGELDAREFERLAAAGSSALAQGDLVATSRHLLEALALWSGPALAEFAGEPFARVEAARLESVRLQALEDRFAADLGLRRHAAVIAELSAAAAEHPLRERFREQLMLALYRSGRQSEALDAYADARAVLADQLGVDPGPALTRLHAAVLHQDPRLDLPDPPAPVYPPLTSFVGRARDFAEINTRLGTGRLVTITGYGGVGKSRLAVELAAAGGSDFPGGVWLVELASLARADLVAPAVAAALRVREHPRRDLTSVLVDRLREAEGLLVLDNCEHVLDEAAMLTDRLLRACPRLRILATSRERLGVPGEHVWPLEGLDTADAVRLLVERATAVRPGFAPGPEAAGGLEQICRRLDCVPLAIELAAAVVPTLGVGRTASRLDDRFATLVRGNRTGEPRHRTLRAVADWSYDLLDKSERRLFDQLGVFVGGFTVEAVEAVCAADGGPTLAVVLTALVDKSLVVLDGDRHRLLETLRAYAADHLAESAAPDALRGRHAGYLLALVSKARRASRGPEEAVWLRRLEDELGNIRAALEWSIDRGDAGTAVRLAGSLYPLWDRHGRYREGREWLARALALGTGLPPLVRARALDGLAGLAVIQGDLTEGKAAAEESAALSRANGDPAGVARALTTLGLAALNAGDTAGAVPVLEEALRQARTAGDRAQAGWVLIHLGVTALTQGAWSEAVRRCDEGEPDLRTAEDVEGLAFIDLVRCGAATRAGDPEGAGSALRDARQGFSRLEHRWGLSICLQLQAEAAAAASDHRLAVWLAASAQTLRESVAAAPMPFLEDWRESLMATCRATLGERAFAAAWQAGTTGEAVDKDPGRFAS